MYTLVSNLSTVFTILQKVETERSLYVMFVSAEITT